MPTNHSQIGHLRDPDSNELLETIVPHKLPVLIQADGVIHQITNPNDLLYKKLTPNDLYLVGPHGEITPFISLAIKQRLLQGYGQNSIFHIDAHPDNCHVTNILPNGVDWKYVALHTKNLISAFLEAEDPETIEKTFENLTETTRSDVATFLKALERTGYFHQFIACLREPNQTDARIYNPTKKLENWSLDSNKNQQSIDQVIQSTHVDIYSIDADFCECYEDNASVLIRQRFFERLEYLLQGLNVELEKTDKSLATIYTISLDPDWCTMPREFLMEFMTRFYRHLINCQIESSEPYPLSGNLRTAI